MAGLASGRAVQSRCVTLYPVYAKFTLGWPQMKLANLSISSRLMPRIVRRADLRLRRPITLERALSRS